MTKRDLVVRISEETGLIQEQVLSVVQRTLDYISDALAKGENLKISGFGTFLLRDKGQRVGRNPKTGVEVPITPRRVLTFRASQMLKARISGK